MKFFILLFFLLPYSSIFAQTDELVSLNGITVDISVNNEVIYIHTIEANHTMYSLSRFFKIPIERLMSLNSITPGQTIALGSQIKIPLDKEHIVTSIEKHNENWIPLLYYVKKRENLYKLSHVYFPQKIEYLVSRNDISGFALKENQEMVIGYWNPSKTNYTLAEKPVEKRPEFFFKRIPGPDGFYFEKIITTQAPSNIEIADFKVDSTYFDKAPLENHKTVKGIAIWEKSWTDDGNLYVLHKTAREKSMIKLRNPIVGLTVEAQVIGSIPEGIYTDDVDIILNPAVAKKLGALDSRLRIEMDYYE